MLDILEQLEPWTMKGEIGWVGFHGDLFARYSTYFHAYYVFELRVWEVIPEFELMVFNEKNLVQTFRAVGKDSGLAKLQQAIEGSKQSRLETICKENPYRESEHCQALWYRACGTKT